MNNFEGQGPSNEEQQQPEQQVPFFPWHVDPTAFNYVYSMQQSMLQQAGLGFLAPPGPLMNIAVPPATDPLSNQEPIGNENQNDGENQSEAPQEAPGQENPVEIPVEEPAVVNELPAESLPVAESEAHNPEEDDEQEPIIVYDLPEENSPEVESDDDDIIFIGELTFPPSDPHRLSYSRIRTTNGQKRASSAESQENQNQTNEPALSFTQVNSFNVDFDESEVEGQDEQNLLLSPEHDQDVPENSAAPLYESQGTVNVSFRDEEYLLSLAQPVEDDTASIGNAETENQMATAVEEEFNVLVPKDEPDDDDLSQSDTDECRMAISPITFQEPQDVEMPLEQTLANENEEQLLQEEPRQYEDPMNPLENETEPAVSMESQISLQENSQQPMVSRSDAVLPSPMEIQEAQNPLMEQTSQMLPQDTSQPQEDNLDAAAFSSAESLEVQNQTATATEKEINVLVPKDEPDDDDLSQSDPDECRMTISPITCQEPQDVEIPLEHPLDNEEQPLQVDLRQHQDPINPLENENELAASRECQTSLLQDSQQPMVIRADAVSSSLMENQEAQNPMMKRTSQMLPQDICQPQEDNSDSAALSSAETLEVQNPTTTAAEEEINVLVPKDEPDDDDLSQSDPDECRMAISPITFQESQDAEMPQEQTVVNEHGEQLLQEDLNQQEDQIDQLENESESATSNDCQNGLPATSELSIDGRADAVSSSPMEIQETQNPMMERTSQTPPQDTCQSQEDNSDDAAALSSIESFEVQNPTAAATEEEFSVLVPCRMVISPITFQEHRDVEMPHEQTVANENDEQLLQEDINQHENPINPLENENEPAALVECQTSLQENSQQTMVSRSNAVLSSPMENRETQNPVTERTSQIIPQAISQSQEDNSADLTHSSAESLEVQEPDEERPRPTPSASLAKKKTPPRRLSHPGQLKGGKRATIGLSDKIRKGLYQWRQDGFERSIALWRSKRMFTKHLVTASKKNRTASEFWSSGDEEPLVAMAKLTLGEEKSRLLTDKQKKRFVRIIKKSKETIKEQLKEQLAIEERRKKTLEANTRNRRITMKKKYVFADEEESEANGPLPKRNAKKVESRN